MAQGAQRGYSAGANGYSPKVGRETGSGIWEKVMKKRSDELAKSDTRMDELIFDRDNNGKGNGKTSFAIFARTLRP